MNKKYTVRLSDEARGVCQEIVKRLKDNPQLGAVFLTNIVPAAGALPIMLGEEVIGAAGVSGV